MKARPSQALGDTLLHVAVRRAALKVIGSRIKEAREAHNDWTQADLAGALYKIGELRTPNATTISRWERGVADPGVYTLERIAEMLEQPLDFFTKGLGAKPQQTGQAVPVETDHPGQDEALLSLVQRQMLLLERFVAWTTGLPVEDFLEQLPSAVRAQPISSQRERRTHEQR